MTYLDIALLIPLVWGGVKGFKKGFIIEIATLIAFVGGIYIGIKFTDAGALYLRNEFAWDLPYLTIIVFTIIFIGVILGVHFIAKLLEKGIKLIALGMVNRIAGALFACFKYIIILSVLIYLIEMINPLVQVISKEQQAKSVLYDPLKKVSKGIFPLMEYIKEETHTN